jgi:CheY-like chemotaxis protein
MTTRVNHRSIEILLVEDSPTDVLIAEEALQYTERLNRLHVVGNGIEAMSFLPQQAPYRAAPRPALILLDLNLPKQDGREVLAEIKADQDL